ncbi:hypothetical protein KP509_21G045000 [Ceratopteris richardii]|uniref:Secreted protein n=1 Tax=Ceratopteris richardii TaxID=49495 RepID=A0A8T2SD31_CERRI|nr:hypothetical protein KP509_21G045000 [Ceratopteris richardii]
MTKSRNLVAGVTLTSANVWVAVWGNCCPSCANVCSGVSAVDLFMPSFLTSFYSCHAFFYQDHAVGQLVGLLASRQLFSLQSDSS